MAQEFSSVTRDEARIRRAISVLDDERHSLAAHLIMALTPADGDAPSEQIQAATVSYCERVRLVHEAERALKALIPFRVDIPA